MNRTLLVTFLFVLVEMSAGAHPAPLSDSPKDKFSKSFLKIYREAPKKFERVKYRKNKSGDRVDLVLSKLLPGSTAGWISKEQLVTCTYRFQHYPDIHLAEVGMNELVEKVVKALRGSVMLKNLEASADLVKGIAIAEVKDAGFDGYNIEAGIRQDAGKGGFSVHLAIKGGTNTHYRFIFKNEPVRSALFLQIFKNVYTQFTGSNGFKCEEVLPGFRCSLRDSGDRKMLVMEKVLTDFPDSRVEFESLTSSLRSILGEKYLYYEPRQENEESRRVVFIHANDYDKTERKSIVARLEMKDEQQFVVSMSLVHL